VGEILDQAWTLLKADDGRNAITMLEAITEKYLAEWENFDDSDGEASDFFSTLGEAWTEALLSADMPDKERKSWAARLDSWQQGLDDYGVEDVFAAAQATGFANSKRIAGTKTYSPTIQPIAITPATSDVTAPTLALLIVAHMPGKALPPTTMPRINAGTV
jgi:hypothetical protein